MISAGAVLRAIRLTTSLSANTVHMLEMVTSLCQSPVEVSEYSQLCGSLGAALFALEKMGVKL